MQFWYSLREAGFALMSKKEKRKLKDRYGKTVREILRNCGNFSLCITAEEKTVNGKKAIIRKMFWGIEADDTQKATANPAAIIDTARMNLNLFSEKQIEGNQLPLFDAPCTATRTIIFSQKDKIPENLLQMLTHKNIAITVKMEALPRKEQFAIVKQNAAPKTLMNRIMNGTMTEQETEEAKKLHCDVMMGNDMLCHVSLTVSGYGETAEEAKGRVQLALDTLKYAGVRISDKGFYTASPDTVWIQNPVKPQKQEWCSMKQWGNLIPFAFAECIDEKGIDYGRNRLTGNPVIFDFRHSSLPSKIMCGIAGSGLHFLAKHELLQVLNDTEDSIIVIDPENDFNFAYANCSEIGVQNISLCRGDYSINPLDVMIEEGFEGFHVQMWEIICEKADAVCAITESLLKRELTIHEANALRKATEAVLQPFIEELIKSEPADGLYYDPQKNPVLSDVLNEMCRQAKGGTKAAACKELSDAIETADLLFARHTNMPDCRAAVLNLFYVPQKLFGAAYMICLQYIWRQLVLNRRKHMKGDYSHLWIYIDEVSCAFRYPHTADTLMHIVKRFRPYGGNLTMLTYDFAPDFLASEQGQAIVNNTGSFVFLNQSAITRKRLGELYNIDDSLLDFIKDRPAGEGLFYICGGNWIPFQL